MIKKNRRIVTLLTGIVGLVLAPAIAIGKSDEPAARDIEVVKNIVVIYAENRSFDNLYGTFPGANGLRNITKKNSQQLDRNGTVLRKLPQTWNGLTATGQKPVVTQAMTDDLANAPFAIDDPDGFNIPLSVTTRDLTHRFYENQMQINGGRNDKFAAWTDSGSLTMGHYSVSAAKLALWKVAKKYVLADNFFMGAFGGSFFNHQWLICACVPYYPNADKSPAADLISAVEADGVTLKLASNSPSSALSGPPKFLKSSNLTPDFYAVNTMQPPYQPSGNAAAPSGDKGNKGDKNDRRFADPSNATTLPPQTAQTIGDLLTAKGISWAWYGGAWQAALNQASSVIYTGSINFQPHHQPFNYFAQFAPGTAARAEHLRDGGMNGSAFIKAIDSGTLPQVAFYKPQGNLSEHPGYASVAAGDQHIANIVRHLERSPQWRNMVVVVTYDENGGFWDHVAPPKGDRWGPGSRIPALIVSPYAKRGTVDHTLYDTTSILRFITKRYSLPVLPGIAARDAATGGKLGDLTAALDFTR